MSRGRTMIGKDGKETESKKRGYITGCYSCNAYYTHHQLLSERRNGVTLKFGKIYCLFSKKPVKLDARKRHTEIPSNCPRYNVPVRFAVYTLKKRAPAEDAGDAARYWRVYSGSLAMAERRRLIADGSYSEPDSKDGFLWNGGEQVHKLQADDVVVREDGFTIRAWRWSGDYFLSHFDFNEAGIKKMPSRVRK